MNLKKDEEYQMVIEPPHRFSIDINELWQSRELFYFFTWRDIKVKYKQTVLGVLWVVLQPLFMMLIFTFFLSRMLGVPSQGIPYPVFAFSGLLLWNFFAASVNNAANSMMQNAPIIKKIYFPRLIIPITSVLTALADLVISFFLFVALLFIYPLSISYMQILFFWPAAFLVSLIAAVGLGCGLSALVVKYRDFRFVVPFLTQICFFITPIVYPDYNDKNILAELCTCIKSYVWCYFTLPCTFSATRF